MLVIRNCLLIACFLISQALFAEVIEVDVEGLHELIGSGVTVIDVRTPGEWKQTGIVEGSVPIMFFNEKRKPLTQKWMHEAAKYVQPDSPLVLICRSGNRSRIIGNFLVKQHGYKNVYNVSKGINNWIAKGNKTVEVR
ncbi:MAG: rhodanese-like domain-containing protein [Gammaproteobacteria bacterium]|nr:rhodanese-like domain-containing protein [Gammaproteobacteria bacterium]